MDVTPFPTSPEPAVPDEYAERSARHLRMLAELSGIGMEMARLVALQAAQLADAADKAEAEPTPDETPEAAALRRAAVRAEAGDLALTFSRVSRAVRQSVALEAKLSDEQRQIQTRAGHLIERREAEREAHRNSLRTKRIDELRYRLKHDPNGGAEVASMLRVLADELKTPDWQRSMTTQELGAFVETVSEELGLPFDPTLWDRPGVPQPLHPIDLDMARAAARAAALAKMEADAARARAAAEEEDWDEDEDEEWDEEDEEEPELAAPAAPFDPSLWNP